MLVFLESPCSLGLLGSVRLSTQKLREVNMIIFRKPILWLVSSLRIQDISMDKLELFQKVDGQNGIHITSRGMIYTQERC